MSQNQGLSLGEKSFEVEVLKKRIEELETENAKFKILLDEFGNIEQEVSDEEIICVRELSKLKNLSMERSLDIDEISMLEKLMKSLKSVRSESKRKKPNKLDDVEDDDLIEIVLKRKKSDVIQ